MARVLLCKSLIFYQPPAEGLGSNLLPWPVVPCSWPRNQGPEVSLKVCLFGLVNHDSAHGLGPESQVSYGPLQQRILPPHLGRWQSAFWFSLWLVSSTPVSMVSNHRCGWQGRKQCASPPNDLGCRSLGKRVQSVTKAPQPPPRCTEEKPPPNTDVWLTALEELDSSRWIQASKGHRDVFWHPGHTGCTDLRPSQLWVTENSHRELILPPAVWHWWQQVIKPSGGERCVGWHQPRISQPVSSGGGFPSPISSPCVYVFLFFISHASHNNSVRWWWLHCYLLVSGVPSSSLGSFENPCSFDSSNERFARLLIPERG